MPLSSPGNGIGAGAGVQTDVQKEDAYETYIINRDQEMEELLSYGAANEPHDSAANRKRSANTAELTASQMRRTAMRQIPSLDDMHANSSSSDTSSTATPHVQTTRMWFSGLGKESRKVYTGAAKQIAYWMAQHAKSPNAKQTHNIQVWKRRIIYVGLKLACVRWRRHNRIYQGFFNSEVRCAF
jgi:hypothetical protein